MIFQIGPLMADQSQCDDPKSASITNAVCLFSNPLLVGASLTRGYGANPGGPGAIIAATLSPESQITNMAQSGVKSVDSLKDHVIPANAPSIVMGLDLFFWDAARNDCDASFIGKTKSFIKLYQDRKIPMILGKLPLGVKFPKGYSVLNNTECTKKINDLLDSECTIENNCLIYDPKECFAKMSEADRNRYFVDSLHTSAEANKFCSKVFIAGNQYQKLTCQPK